MSSKVLETKRLLTVIAILMTFTFCLVTPNRRQAQQAISKPIGQKETVDDHKKSGGQSGKIDNAGKTDKGKKNISKQAAGLSGGGDQTGKTENLDKKKMKLALSAIEDIFYMTNDVRNPVVRMKIRMLVAEAYWNYQSDKAKEIFFEDFPQIASISVPQHELEIGKVWSIKELGKPPSYKGRDLEMVKTQLRREMLTIISARDTELARLLVSAEKKDEKKDDHVEERRDEVLSTAGSLADTNPEAAARIIREYSKSSISDELPFLLIRLREKSPDEASVIFNQVFSIVRASGDLWGFQKLVPYILPSEKDRLIGGRHYLTDPQRMKDAITLMDYGVTLLARRIEMEPPGNMAPEIVRREFYLWRNLISVFKDIKPESVWLVNTRINQLSALVPRPAQGSIQGPWSDERHKQLMSAVESSTGDKRDGLLESAAFNAWRFGGGDYDLAISLAERIMNTEMRDRVTGNLHAGEGLKVLHNEGPDKSLKLAGMIKSPVARVRLYAAIINTLHSVKATERVETLHEELLNWLHSCERNTDTAWGVLEYLESFQNDNLERSFVAMDILISVLNSASFDPPDKPLRGKIYWYPEFHDFRKSLAPLARADFERGLQAIQMLTNNEAAMLIQASFCGEYLKMRAKNKKSSEKPKP